MATKDLDSYAAGIAKEVVTVVNEFLEQNSKILEPLLKNSSFEDFSGEYIKLSKLDIAIRLLVLNIRADIDAMHEIEHLIGVFNAVLEEENKRKNLIRSEK